MFVYCRPSKVSPMNHAARPQEARTTSSRSPTSTDRPLPIDVAMAAILWRQRPFDRNTDERGHAPNAMERFRTMVWRRWTCGLFIEHVVNYDAGQRSVTCPYEARVSRRLEGLSEIAHPMCSRNTIACWVSCDLHFRYDYRGFQDNDITV